MEYPHPATFHPDLTNERLCIIASRLLDVRYMTIRQMDTEFDDNYTRECPVYGRSRKMLVALARSNEFPWLAVTCMGMGVKISIGGVVCKFFRDALDNPEKAGFFKQETFVCLFEEPDDVPVLWRFVIARALTEEDEDQIYFVGYNKFNEKISMWHYEGGSPILHSIDQMVPQAANMEPANIEVREFNDKDNLDQSESDAAFKPRAIVNGLDDDPQ